MKHKIKKGILSLSLFLLLGVIGNAQGVPVYDNTNFISLVKQLVE